MIRLSARRAVVTLIHVGLALGLVGQALAQPTAGGPDLDFYKDSLAWRSGQALCAMAGLHAVPRLSGEEREEREGLDEVVRVLHLPPPIAPDLTGREPGDLETSARFLLQGEGMRIIEGIRGTFGPRPGTLAELATRIRLLGAAWPDHVDRFGIDLIDEVERLALRARIPRHLLLGLRNAIVLQQAAPELQVAVHAALRKVAAHLAWSVNVPTEADVRLAAWAFGLYLGNFEILAVQEGLSEDVPVVLLSLATRLGIDPPALKLARLTEEAEIRAHLVNLRMTYATTMHRSLMWSHGATTTALVDVAWSLAFPKSFCTPFHKNPVPCAMALQVAMTRQRLPKELWQPVVEALRRGESDDALGPRWLSMVQAIEAHLKDARQRRLPFPPETGTILNVALVKESIYSAGLHLARATLGAAHKPGDADALLRMQNAVDAAYELGCLVMPPPEPRGELESDVAAAVDYLRQGGAQRQGARIEERTGAQGRAMFDVGIWSEMLRTFYEPGSERTRRRIAALRQAIEGSAFMPEIWDTALRTAAEGAPAEQVTQILGEAQDEWQCQLSELCSGRAFEER
jgi:hypothetical protein